MTTQMNSITEGAGRHVRRAGRYFNAARCASEFAAVNVDGVVASTVENIVYLTGYDHWPLRTFRDHGVFAFVNADGRRGLVAPRNAGEYLAVAGLEDCILYTHGDFFVTEAPRDEFTDTDRRWESVRAETPSFPDAVTAVAAMLTELGFSWSSRLALDDQAISFATRAAIKSQFPFDEAIDGNALLRSVRRVKTPDEVAGLTDVALRTEQAMNAVFRSVEIGTSETELWTRYQHESVNAGMVPGHCEVNIAKRASGCFPPDPDVRAQLGDVIRIDCGGRLNGFSSDTGRNAHIGPMPPRLKLAEQAIHAAITAMFEFAAPGVRVVDLAELAIQTVRDNGVPTYNRHHVGHGIGLEMYEFPVLSPTQDPDVVLLEGEVLNFEVPFYELGTGGLQIEDTVLVTNSGVDVITTNSRTALSIDSPTQK